MDIPRATFTQLRKIKALATTLQRSDPSIPRHRALGLAAQKHGFRDWHHASNGSRVTSEPAVPKDSLSPSGLHLVQLLAAMADAEDDDDAYLDRRLHASSVWRTMADAGPQTDLLAVQRSIVPSLPLCLAYFEVVKYGLDLAPQLARFPYSAATILNFDLPDWSAISPVARVTESSRRALLNTLRQQFGPTGDIRLSRLAVVTHHHFADVPDDRAVFHAARSCFHVYDKPSKPLHTLPDDHRGAVLGVVAYLSMGHADVSSWDHFDHKVDDLGNIPNPGYHVTFEDGLGSSTEAYSFGSSDLALYLCDPSWQGISNLVLPSPPGVANHNPGDLDPFVLRLTPRLAIGQDNDIPTYIVEVAALHLAREDHAFQYICTTRSPAVCVAWCDYYLRTIRAGGKVVRVDVVA